MHHHPRAILRLGLPIAMGQLGVIVMGFADTMRVGRYSTTALAAASFVNSAFNLIFFMLVGYSYGLTPLIAGLFGRGERGEAGRTLGHAVVCNLLYAAVLVAVMSGVYFCLSGFGQPEEVLPLVRPYYLCILASMPFVALFNVLRQFTDGITETRTAMWVLLAGNALNLLGNWLLIYGVGPFPEWGLTGAGVSTLVARVAVAVILLAHLCLRGRYADYRAGLRHFLPRRPLLQQIHRQSFPISLQMGMETGAFTLSCVMAGWLGAGHLAAFQVMLTVGTLGYLFYYSFGSGLSIRVALFYGQKDWPEVRRATAAGTHILLGMALISSSLMWGADRWLVGLFTSDPAVLSLALSLIPPLVLYQLGDAMQVCYANALRGTAQVKAMMWIAFVSYLCVNLPMGYFRAFVCGWESFGLFIAFSFGLFTAALLFLRSYRRALAEAGRRG